MAARLILPFVIIGVAAAGGFKVSWSECDPTAHAHMKSLTPDAITLGQKTTFTGVGALDEAVSGGQYQVQVTAGGLSILDHSGDICKPETITIKKFFVTVGTMNWHGFKCPMAKGDTSVEIDVQLSSSIPSWLASPEIKLTGSTSNNDKLLCVTMKMSSQSQMELSSWPQWPTTMPANVESAMALAGGFKVSWSECDPTAHAHMKSLTPDAITLGQKTTFTGVGALDEAVSGGQYHVQVTAAGMSILDHSGDICKPETITIKKFFVTVGTMTWHGFKCPMAKGETSVGIDVQLSASIPSWLASPQIKLTGSASNKDTLLCVLMKMSSQSKELVLV